MLQILTLINTIVSTIALHHFLPTDIKKEIYTSFVPPSAERFFTSQFPSVASSKTAAGPFSVPYTTSYGFPYIYQPYSPVAVKQYPLHPAAVYPLQPYNYPPPGGPASIVYVPRYPFPTDNVNELGGVANGSGWNLSNWSQWVNWFNTPSNLPGAEGIGSQGPQESNLSNDKKTPEKIEVGQTEITSQDSEKLQADKNSSTKLLEQQQQQPTLIGPPQFFGHFAAFPANKDPINLQDATNGAISSFLLTKDPNEGIITQKPNSNTNTPLVSASLAYQRFLVLSKQRSEESNEPMQSTTEPPSAKNDKIQINFSNTTGSDNRASTIIKSSDTTSPTNSHI